MAEVLSQSQIDMLLNAVRSGERELEPTDNEAPEKKYRKYDFSSPRKFTKDRIRMLTGIFENYARIINSRLNARLRTNCEISVESVEEQRYYEFSNALIEGDVLALLDVEAKGEKQDSTVMLYLSTQMVLGMIDRMMGGEDTVPTSVALDYTYTDIELKLYEDIVTDLVSAMGSSWSNYIPLEFSFRKIDTDPTISQLLGLEEIVVLVNMQVKFNGISGRMSVCLPGEMLSEIFAAVSAETPRKAAAENMADDIFDQLRDSNLDVIAALGQTQISLRDVYHLGVGDVIDLGCAKDSPIYLNIGGYSWFAGRVGTHDKNMAVKIEEICNETGQRSK